MHGAVLFRDIHLEKSSL